MKSLFGLFLPSATLALSVLFTGFAEKAHAHKQYLCPTIKVLDKNDANGLVLLKGGCWNNNHGGDAGVPPAMMVMVGAGGVVTVSAQKDNKPQEAIRLQASCASEVKGLRVVYPRPPQETFGCTFAAEYGPVGKVKGTIVWDNQEYQLLEVWLTPAE